VEKKKLKILEVAPYFYPAWAYGGIPRVVYGLSKELVKRGHEVTVYTTDVLDEVSRCSFSNGETDIEGVRARYFRNLSNPLAYHYQVFLPAGLCAAVRSTISDFDVIHLHGHRNLLNNIVHYYCRKAGKPYILSAHGTVLNIERMMLAKSIFDKIFGRQILRDAHHFVAVSGNEIRQYELMGIGRDRVSMIHNGIDVSSFDNLPPKNIFREKHGLTGKKIVLFLGKLTPRKGVDFLVRAFSELDREDTVLVIAGNDMGFRREVEKVIHEKKVGHKVIFTGLLTGDDKLAAYQDADVLVYPSIHEIFGLVPFEAIMCGTPVIVTDDCGCGEIIGKNDIGYIVKYNDSRGLRESLGKVLEDRAAAAEKVSRGIKFIEEHLSWGKIAAMYEDMYLKML
jgi:glycosyltransferase involved in cell wall biosynthesis